MKETGSNEELLALIIVSISQQLNNSQGSLDDWDDKMQIECANAFVDPLQNNVGLILWLTIFKRVTPINR